jgi:hypothetical protein
MVCEGRRHRDWVPQLQGPTQLRAPSVQAMAGCLEQHLDRRAGFTTANSARAVRSGLRLDLPG